MGCSGGQKSILEKKSVFEKEAHGYKRTNMGLMNVQDNQHYVQLTENYPKFYEEKIESAIENGAVRPWLTNIVPPILEIEENTELPKYSLKIDHVFGFRNDDTRQNLFFLSDDQIVYTTSSLGIIQNIDDLSQVVFGGNESNGKRTCHNNDIMSIAFYSGEISMVATGQRSMKPMILVWSPSDPNVIYAKFHQTIGSKEVSGIDFDSRGYYIGSYGKDEGNSFFIFHMRSKSLYWTEETGKDQTLLDLKFDPYHDRFCICGFGKVIFCDIIKKSMSNVINGSSNSKLKEEVFTTIAYIDDRICAIGAVSGKLYLFKGQKFFKTVTVSYGSIVIMKYYATDEQLFISASKAKMYIYNTHRRRYNEVTSFHTESIVNSIDVNDEGMLLMGMKNGNIVIMHYKDKSKRTDIICKSHSLGSVRGLDFISEKHAITSGEDNKIMLWNLRTHSCEAIGDIDSGYNGDFSVKDIISEKKKKAKLNNNKNVNDVNMIYQPYQKSWAVCYNRQKGHIAVGICNGYVSIRQSIKKLNVCVVPDIKVGDVSTNEETVTNMTEENTTTNKLSSETGRAITEMKYTNYGDLLAVACENGILAILNANDKYTIVKQIIFDNFITNLDWDLTNKYIQIVTIDNRFMFVDYKASVIKKATNLRNVEWPNFTCKFGYTVQGVYMGLTDPDFIKCVCKAHTKNIIVSGDDQMNINLYNYPTISENPKVKSYCGHSENVVRICFSPDDNKLMTISGMDKSVILWSVNQD